MRGWGDGPPPKRTPSGGGGVGQRVSTKEMGKYKKERQELLKREEEGCGRGEGEGWQGGSRGEKRERRRERALETQGAIGGRGHTFVGRSRPGSSTAAL